MEEYVKEQHKQQQ